MAKIKIKKTPLWLLFKPKQVRKGGEREKIKISFRSVPFLPDGKFKIPKKEKKK